MPSCKKGTRKNKSTGKCESTKNKTLSNRRINIIIEKERKFRKISDKLLHTSTSMSSPEMNQYKKKLSELHFETHVKLNQINDMSTALRKSIEHKNDFGQMMADNP